MADAQKVTTSKPQVGGAISVAPVGTTLPEDASSTLATAFKGLGYVSEDGVRNPLNIESAEQKAWGGDIVNAERTGMTDRFSFKLIEGLNTDVLKTVFGADNVTIDTTTTPGTTKIAVAVGNHETDKYSWVIDMIMKGDALKRIVIPSASITEIGEIVYRSGEVVGYDVTLTCEADEDYNTHYEYIE